MEIEDTDSIEKEFDIVYSGHFSNDAKIFQFPLIPKDSLNIENIHSLSISENLKKVMNKIDLKKERIYLCSLFLLSFIFQVIVLLCNNITIIPK